MTRPTVPQVMALAVDAASLRAGQALATSEPWSGTGCDQRAVWGACRGSARAPYQVACDNEGPAYRCTCPSRKFPCKHAIGLLLLWAKGSPAVTESAPPADVAAWLGARSTKQPKGTIASAVAGKEAPASVPEERAAAEPVADEEAVVARARQRIRRIVAGMEELDRWLSDLVHRGLGHVQDEPYSFWDNMGARLVDAQAPGAASRVRGLPGRRPQR